MDKTYRYMLVNTCLLNHIQKYNFRNNITDRYKVHTDTGIQ